MVFADLDNDGALDLAVGYPGGIGIFYGDGVQPREPRVHIPVPRGLLLDDGRRRPGW